MPISFRCSNPQCGKNMRAPDGTSGRKAKCPLCGTVQIIPEPEIEDLPTFTADEDYPIFDVDQEVPRSSSPQSVSHPEIVPPTRPVREVPHTPAMPPIPSPENEPADEDTFFTTLPKFQAEAEDKGPKVHCQDCNLHFPASDMLCPNCGWVNQQAMGDFTPTPVKAGGGLMKEYLRAITFGYSNFGSLLKLVACSLSMLFVFYLLFIFSAIFAIFGGTLGALIFVGVIFSSALVMGGYFLRFYLDCIMSSLEGLDQAPEVPDFQFGELCKIGAKGFGIICVYVFPVITIPLLPLALLAWGYSDDLRPFDVRWALRAAAKKPKQLAQLWVMLIFWGVLGSLIVDSTEYTTTILIHSLGEAIGGGVIGFIVKWILLIIVGIIISAVSQMFMTVLFRCIGILGQSHREILNSLPEETSIRAVSAYISGGLIVSVCVLTLLFGFALQNAAEVFKYFGQGGDDSALVDAETELKYKHKEQSNDYLTTVMRQMDAGKSSVSSQNMKHLGTALKTYEALYGEYPDKLKTLADEGSVSEKMLYSEQDSTSPIVYNPPKGQAEGSWVLAYDPKPKFGDMFAVLFNDGSVKTVAYQELDNMLKKQGSPPVK